jgi:hypothetical protein
VAVAVKDRDRTDLACRRRQLVLEPAGSNVQAGRVNGEALEALAQLVL